MQLVGKQNKKDTRWQEGVSDEILKSKDVWMFAPMSSIDMDWYKNQTKFGLQLLKNDLDARGLSINNHKPYLDDWSVKMGWPVAFINYISNINDARDRVCGDYQDTVEIMSPNHRKNATNDYKVGLTYDSKDIK